LPPFLKTITVEDEWSALGSVEKTEKPFQSFFLLAGVYITELYDNLRKNRNLTNYLIHDYEGMFEFGCIEIIP